MKGTHLNCTIKFIVNESTQPDEVASGEKPNYSGVHVSINGVDEKFSISIGRSKLKRVLTPKKFKEKIPSPYFVKINRSPDENQVRKVVELVLKYGLAKFSVRNGMLECEIFSENVDLTGVVGEIEGLFSA